MKTEPDWQYHDRTRNSPVSAEHEVERERYLGGPVRCKAKDAYWPNTLRYRDWTAFAQQQAGEVPAFPIGAKVEKINGPQWRGVVVGHYSSSFTPEGLVIECTVEGARGQVHVEPAKRMRLIEQPPVDPLREALAELRLAEQCITAVDWADRAADFLRARGVTIPEGEA